MSNTMIMLGSIITAIATTVIAIFSWRSYYLSRDLKKAAEDQNKREVALRSV